MRMKTDTIKVGGLRDENAQLRRERDALQQQVYDLAARLASTERELCRCQGILVEISHDKGARILQLESILKKRTDKAPAETDR
jgi:hypothetical protein